MKYIDGFRNSDAALAVRKKLHALGAVLAEQDRDVRVMEVCGTHTVAIARSGIRSILPPNVDLISGPGCPVCVTDTGYIDAALELARRRVVIATFGDMIKVPGTQFTLAKARSVGATVQVCYSPLEAVSLAASLPTSEVVFLAVGFETTIGPVISIIEEAQKQKIKNISLLTAFKTVPGAMLLLASDPEIRINAFLCPAHVSAIIGAKAYEPIAKQCRVPCVVAGFEPLDILLGLEGILAQLTRRESVVDNQYSRVVKPEGNKKAQALMDKYLEPMDANWRGLGTIPMSGLGIRKKFKEYDAAVRHGLKIEAGKAPTGCLCGSVLKGIIKPPQCPLFGKGCTPDHAIGPCMVSSEGSCAAYYKYKQVEEI